MKRQCTGIPRQFFVHAYRFTSIKLSKKLFAAKWVPVPHFWHLLFHFRIVVVRSNGAGNLAVHGRIMGKPRRIRKLLQEIATSLRSSQWQVWEPRPIESILQVLQACMALAERRYDLSPGSLAQGGRCRVTFGSYHFNGDAATVPGVACRSPTMAGADLLKTEASSLAGSNRSG